MKTPLLLADLLKIIVSVHCRKALFFLLLIYGFALPVAAQSDLSPKQWDKTFGGPADDYLRAVVATPDGGYLTGGISFQGGEGGGGESNEDWYDYKIMKVDKDGNKEWDKVYEGNDYDFLYAIVNSPTGGYLLAGYSTSGIGGDKSEESRGRHDYWVIKIDKDGNKEWDKTFGGNDVDLLYSVVTTPDGGYLLGGTSSSDAGGYKSEGQLGLGDYWVIKIDAEGNKQWDKTFGGSNFEEFKSIINTADGGFLLGGSSQSGVNKDKSEPTRGFYDYWIIKIDQDGNKVWDKAFGGSNLDKISTMIATSDDGYLLGGESYSQIGGDKSERQRGANDYWLVKMDLEGNKIWDKTYGGTGSDGLSAVTATTDNGFILGGYSGSGISEDKSEASKGEYDYWIIKVDDSGNKQSDITYGGNRTDNLVTIVATQDNGYLLGGDSFSGAGGDKSDPGFGRPDYWLVKLGVDFVKQDQTISFEVVPDQTYGDADIMIQATASSGLPLTFIVESGPATLIDHFITLTGSGIVNVQVSQDGNSVYNPASPVSISFTVNKATPFITWDPVSLAEDVPIGEEQLSAIATFKDITLDGSFVYNPAAGTILTAGSQGLEAVFTPADATNFNAVVNITRTIIVGANPFALNITSFSPSSGPAGSFVFISGCNLDQAVSVNFNDVSTLYTVLNKNMIVATVPLNATSGLISITETNGSSVFSDDKYRISNPKPKIRFFSPATGTAGKIITIVGTNMQGTTEILFNGLATSQFTVVNDHTLKAKVSSGATTGKITVITPEGRDKSSGNFIVTGNEEPVTMSQAASGDAVNEKQSAASVYPNPFMNSFSITFKDRHNEKIPVILYNAEGKVVLKMPTVSSGQKIHIGRELIPGVYILQLGTGKDSKRFTVVKSK